ncbi:hypothetical protein BCR41DRAFT_348049 [Lobosporangium transversale]|uniref:Uncharacterized protein n=1 Tax=Lobosporangium transversale TaxID=64571 RepID=A0A1Y2GZP5_9FUNG|nr:hypothetical protein BCR41DRAFT_348049 [Lobosporangium transversale]ORZ26282.1 hypothetical protein BCR41DRAFT_348049 [Lobosporangium transversale]|eukprot:XP_021884047.1 hypothetical protein BCR41DRAFT_348049 [Lobosporangium transversale]
MSECLCFFAVDRFKNGFPLCFAHFIFFYPPLFYYFIDGDCHVLLCCAIHFPPALMCFSSPISFPVVFLIKASIIINYLFVLFVHLFNVRPSIFPCSHVLLQQ